MHKAAVEITPVGAGIGLTPCAAARAARALERVRELGARRTPLRSSVLQVLAASPAHLSISQIHSRIDSLGLFSDRSAVNRTLATFVALGLVHTLPSPGDAAYGLSDLAHSHAICTRCGQVTEIAADKLAATMGAAECVTGFVVHPTGLALHGLCPTCQ